MIRELQEGRPLSRAGDSMLLPTRVSAIIAGRLDRLAEREGALVAEAAVIGREFESALLERAAGLESLEAAAVVDYHGSSAAQSRSSNAVTMR